ncbi:MAG: hypothetical protein J0L92_29305 [Deltaproteobacteria bacterium]|nr:hypothetical protein [Deltaproteobacteria bacterium]
MPYKTYPAVITHADSPAQIPDLANFDLGGTLFCVDTSGGPVVLVLPADAASPLARFAQQAYGVPVFKVSGDANPIIIRPQGDQFINDAAPTEDHVLSTSDTVAANVRHWNVKREPNGSHQWKASS